MSEIDKKSQQINLHNLQISKDPKKDSQVETKLNLKKQNLKYADSKMSSAEEIIDDKFTSRTPCSNQSKQNTTHKLWNLKSNIVMTVVNA